MKKILAYIFFLLCSVTTSYAQQVINGTIKDDKETLIGVSISEKGNPNNGVVTDIDGKYRITLRGTQKILVVTYVGYLSREINVGDRTNVDITLEQDTKGLEEVIVVGYGTQKKLTNTGSTSQISGDNIRQVPSASLQNTLIGRLPGITTQQRSGRPGEDGAALLIRGLTTTNGSGAPLIIVDDLEYTGLISDIDADQVETFTVLKDASTTAVFGVKGANGVIVITTRRGKIGKPLITIRTENSLQAPSYLPKYLDSYNSALLINQAIDSDRANGLTPTRARFTDEEIEFFRTGSDPYRYPNVDWTKELLKPFSLQSRNNINVQGGLDKAKYFVSAGYLWQDGLIRDFSKGSGMNSNYYYKRYNFRSNLDFQPTNSLTLNVDLSGNFSERNSPNNQGRNNRNNIFFEISDINQLAPFSYNIYNPDGSYGIGPGAQQNNVVGRLGLYGYQREFKNELTANFRATQKLDFITEGLSVRGVLGFNGDHGFNRNLTRTAGVNDFPSYTYNPTDDSYAIFNNNFYRTGLPSLSYSNQGGYKRINWQASMNYDRTFSDHRVYALGLYNFSNFIEGTATPAVFQGFTFRTGYDYKKKYLLELNAGYNGTSLFSAEKRFNLFPAVSMGWNIAEETFFKETFKFIDLFKIRGSYGLVGSDEMRRGDFDYVYIEQYNRGGSYSLGDVHQNISPLLEGRLGNDSTWELERQGNIGFELNMFKGSLRIEADYFDKYRTRILTPRQSVPEYTGVLLPPSNITKISNRGFEAQVTYNKAFNKDISFNVNGNISVSKNRILFNDEANPAFPWLRMTGNPIGSVLGYEFLGFYTEEDIANPDVPKPIGGNAFAGDLKYRDLDGDGVITVNDRFVMPYPNLPNTILGMTVGFNYKSFSFSVTAQSALNFALRAQAEAVRPFINNFREIHKDSWTPENSVNPSFPRLTTFSNISDPNANNSTFWFRRSDYLRIKTAEIAYNLPKNLVGKVGLQGVRVYTNGYNLFTWSLKEKNIYDFDPENTSGTDGAGFYPQQKIFNLGLQITL